MKPSFVLRHAWREGRSGIRRIGVYMTSITLGVAALVAIHSFRADVDRSIRTESRSLLGADLRLERNRAFSDSVLRVVDSLEAAGATTARVTTLMSMAYAPGSELTRLLQVRAVDGPYPLYGTVRSSPPGRWGDWSRGGEALVDPAVLIQLDVEVGDTLRIGESDFRIAGTVEGLPADVGFQTAVGPRVFIRGADLEETELLRYGSLARHQIFLRLQGADEADRVGDRYEDLFRARAVDFDTAEELAGNLTEGLDTLSRFLGLVGLVALLLGGIGVASAIHVYVKERLDGVAVLRCLGATERDIFLAYLVQTSALGLLGAAAGVALGLGVQLLLPRFLGDLLPVAVTPTFHAGAVAAGLGAGVWIAAIFALIPLLGLREASPLQALRRDFEPVASGRDPLRIGAYVALAASVLLVSLWQAPSARIGAGFAGTLVGILGLLYATARGLTAAVRRFFPRRAGYSVRHGVANLFRPRNQTATITLALGFGVFLVAAVGQVRGSLVDRFTLDRGEGRPNLLLFDIQSDQREELEAALGEASPTNVSTTPVVPAELAAVKGRPVSRLLNENRANRPPRWVLSRLYRNTYRDTLTDAETLVAGEWWEESDDTGGENGAPATRSGPSERGGGGEGEAHRSGGGDARGAGDVARISLEEDLASDLGVGLGDRLTWDVQGARVESVVRSLRTVDWSRFQPNFFVVFEPGVLERAPQTFVALARVPGEEDRARLQGDLVRRFPNVSILDLARIQDTVDSLLDRAAEAINFIAGFSVAAGLLVLLGALATSRFQRMREGALLRTLGARSDQMILVVLSEYLFLGLVAGAGGAMLGAGGGWLVVHHVFELEFRLRPLPLVALWGATAVLTAAVGVLSSRKILREPPLGVLRDTLE